MLSVSLLPRRCRSAGPDGARGVLHALHDEPPRAPLVVRRPRPGRKKPDLGVEVRGPPVRPATAAAACDRPRLRAPSATGGGGCGPASASAGPSSSARSLRDRAATLASSERARARASGRRCRDRSLLFAGPRVVSRLLLAFFAKFRCVSHPCDRCDGLGAGRTLAQRRCSPMIGRINSLRTMPRRSAAKQRLFCCTEHRTAKAALPSSV